MKDAKGKDAIRRTSHIMEILNHTAGNKEKRTKILKISEQSFLIKRSDSESLLILEKGIETRSTNRRRPRLIFRARLSILPAAPTRTMGQRHRRLVGPPRYNLF